VGARGSHLGRDPRQRLRAVDEQLDAAARARRERSRGGPAARLGVERGRPAEAGEAAAVVRADGCVERVPDEVVGTVQRVREQDASSARRGP
jgi:hypothetical protein